MTVLLDAAGATPLAGDDAGLPRRPTAGQHGHALSGRPADRGRDRGGDAPHARRPPRLQAPRLAEHELDQRRGSLLVRRGKGGRRREVGMDEWGREHLRPWLAARKELPVGPLFCIIDGRTPL
jgi:hypothetical protein